MMRILVVDDEIPARERLVRLISELQTGDYQVAAAMENGKQAVDYCQQHEVDLVLMDIRMPVMDGLQAAKMISEQAIADKPAPAVIFTTAYGEYALEAFDAQGTGYLLKPIRRQDLLESLQKARQPTRAQVQAVSEQVNAPLQTQYISGSYQGAKIREPLDNILYFQAEQKYVMAYARDKQLLLDDTLKSLEERFKNHFVRIHRNALVAKARVVGINRKDGQSRLILQDAEEQLEISRRHLGDIKALISK